MMAGILTLAQWVILCQSRLYTLAQGIIYFDCGNFLLLKMLRFHTISRESTTDALKRASKSDFRDLRSVESRLYV